MSQSLRLVSIALPLSVLAQAANPPCVEGRLTYVTDVNWDEMDWDLGNYRVVVRLVHVAPNAVARETFALPAAQPIISE